MAAASGAWVKILTCGELFLVSVLDREGHGGMAPLPRRKSMVFEARCRMAR